MSVLIKGVKMPSNCGECPCNNDSLDCGVMKQNFYHDFKIDPFETKPSVCPLEEISDEEVAFTRYKLHDKTK